MNAPSPTQAPAPLIRVDGLTLEIAALGQRVVDDVSFQVLPGEIVGIVGESGSGKSLTARAILGLAPPAVRQTAGTIRLGGRDIGTMPPTELRAMRGGEVGMVFQEPMTSLNPSMQLGRQLDEGLKLHRDLSPPERRTLILAMLRRIGLPDPEGALTSFPHRFSGGMRQRIMLASVMLLRPKLLIADEPTTALDALVQAEVLALMLELAHEAQTAVLLISHDLPMVASVTDRVIVMERGRIVEEGPTDSLLAAPIHGYTRKLLAAMPSRRPARAVSISEPIVSVTGLAVDYATAGGWWRRRAPMRALHGIDLTVRPGEVVALVGGSGSGKTTLGRAIAGLIQPSSGVIRFNGHGVQPGSEHWRRYRLDCQMVFQDPYSSLDPRMTTGAQIAEALRHEPGLSTLDKARRMDAALAEVGLDASHGRRFPHELSGGQRQRVAIARALVRHPAFVVADEPVSALDMTVRAQVLELLAELQRKQGFACLFISHDLGAVEQIADRVVVLHKGRIVEEGDRDTIFDAPQDDYTRRLLAASPTLEPNGTGGVRLVQRATMAVPTA